MAKKLNLKESRVIISSQRSLTACRPLGFVGRSMAPIVGRRARGGSYGVGPYPSRPIHSDCRVEVLRALGVENCQLALVWLALRSCSHAAISSTRVCLSAIRRSRHWEVRTPSSDSARSSQLPCFGV